MTHGHLYDVSMSLTRLDLKAREIGASVVLFGHTHRLAAEMSQGRSCGVLIPAVFPCHGVNMHRLAVLAIIEVLPDQMRVDFL